LLAIFLVVLVDVLGLTIIWPLLPFYAEHFGASPFVVGAIAGTYATFQLLSGPLLGRLSDRFGRRPLLVVSQAGTLAGFLVLANAHALWVVFLARALDGATAGNLSIAQAYIADVTEPKDRAKSFGVIGIAFGLGFMAGPALSAWLAPIGLVVPIYVAAGLSLTSILATTFLLPDERDIRPAQSLATTGDAGPAGRRLGLFSFGAYAPYFRRPGLAGALVQFFLFAFSFSTFMSGFAMFAERRFRWNGHPFGAREVGIVLAYAGLLGIFIQGGLVGRLVRAFGERRVVVASFALSAVGYALTGEAFGFAMLALCTTLSAFGTGPLRPAITAIVSQHADPTEQGVVLGLTQSLQAIAAITAPLLGGLLIDHELLRAWAWVAAGAMLVGMLLALRTLRAPAPLRAAPTTPPAA